MTIYALGIFGHGIAVTGSQVLPFRVRSVDPWFPFQVDKLQVLDRLSFATCDVFGPLVQQAREVKHLLCGLNNAEPCHVGTFLYVSIMTYHYSLLFGTKTKLLRAGGLQITYAEGNSLWGVEKTISSSQTTRRHLIVGWATNKCVVQNRRKNHRLPWAPPSGFVAQHEHPET